MDALGCIDMGTDIGAPIRCRLDGGAHLVFGILQALERIIERGDTAPGHDLDLAGALHQLLAGAAQNLGAPVCDGHHAHPFTIAQIAIGAWKF